MTTKEEIISNHELLKRKYPRCTCDLSGDQPLEELKFRYELCQEYTRQLELEYQTKRILSLGALILNTFEQKYGINLVKSFCDAFVKSTCTRMSREDLIKEHRLLQVVYPTIYPAKSLDNISTGQLQEEYDTHKCNQFYLELYRRLWPL